MPGCLVNSKFKGLAKKFKLSNGSIILGNFKDRIIVQNIDDFELTKFYCIKKIKCFCIFLHILYWVE